LLVELDAVFAAIPSPVVDLCQRLADGGQRAWVVGGCVRDTLRGVPAKDWDIATDAHPKRVMKLFKRVIPTGIKHGTVTVLLAGEGYEVTTLRGEGEYRDGRHPSEVTFLDDIAEDLARRDFTVNAIALDPLARDVVDPFGGQDDLRSRTLRAVGVARDRFCEDGLRILRAARFAATLPANVEPQTRAAMAHPEARRTLAQVSVERVHDEWMKAMKATQPSIAFELMREVGVLELHAPELAALANAALEDAPALDKWHHTMAALDACTPDPVLRVAALLHELVPDVADALLRRLKFSNDDRNRIRHAVTHHRIAEPEVLSDSALRRWLVAVTAEALDDVAAIALASCHGRGTEPTDALQARRALLARARAELDAGVALTTKQLAIGGKDLIVELGMKPGKHLGVLLETMLERVLDDPQRNTRSDLLELARREGDA
jgi:tRNA nucleotidyltransferase (CCA-adding enzyme)